jgi:phenylacetate-CoA ligase
MSEKLRDTVIHAYHKVPFYNELYNTANVPINSISTVRDMSSLPTITRRHFQNTSLEDRTAVDADVGSCGVIRSSGTTGVPISVLEDPYSAVRREGLMLRFLWAYGVRPLDQIAKGRYLTEAAHPTYLAERQGIWSVIRKRVVKEQFFIDFNDQYEFLSKYKPDVLVTGVPYCKALARYCETLGKSLNFKMVLTSGDIVDDQSRKLIAESFGAEVFDNYGLEEVGGSVAWECPTHYGYHINAESLVVEFLENGEPVDAGEIGNVYVTCFHRKATPIVRYFTGDRARFVEEECPCGRGLPLLREVQGRVLDFILTSDGRYVSPHVVLRSLADTAGVQQFKVTQNEDFSIEIQIKTDTEQTEAIVSSVKQRFKTLFGATPLDVRLVDAIDTSGVKYRVVESRATAPA